MMSDKTKAISLKRQNYLEIIYDLCKEHGSATTKGIASKLKVKMPSVTEAVKNLSEEGFVNYTARQAITLTEKGLQTAVELDKRHTILEEFFSSLGCSHAEASRTACLVEHDIDSNISEKLASLTSIIKSGKIKI